MTDKPKRGRPPKAESKRRRNTINVRLDDAAHSEVEQAASEAGRSLSGEIQHRLADYERMSEVINAITKDRTLIPAIIGISNMKQSAAEYAIRDLPEDAAVYEAAYPASYAFAWAMRALFTRIELTLSEHLQEVAEKRDDVSTDLARNVAERLSRVAAQEYGLDLWRACFPPGAQPGETLLSAGIYPEPIKRPSDFVPPPSAKIQSMRATILKAGKTKPVATILGGRGEEKNQT